MFNQEFSAQRADIIATTIFWKRKNFQCSFKHWAAVYLKKCVLEYIINCVQKGLDISCSEALADTPDFLNILSNKKVFLFSDLLSHFSLLLAGFTVL